MIKIISLENDEMKNESQTLSRTFLDNNYAMRNIDKNTIKIILKENDSFIVKCRGDKFKSKIYTTFPQALIAFLNDDEDF